MKKIFLALDNLEKKEILELVEELNNQVMFKLNDAFVKFGPELVKEIRKKGGEIFLDLKFHDIPNTAGNYAKAAAEMNVFVFNVHCLGGIEMMKKAREETEKYCKQKNLRKPLIVGVTILTSMNEKTLKKLKINASVEEMVLHLALNAKKAGLDGVVCSPKEIELIKKACGKNFLCITPGIRPEYASSNDDQKRILTPKQAVKKGADFLVIGRPIIQAEKYKMKRKQAVKQILNEIQQ